MVIYYNVIDYNAGRKLQIMSRESSIQLIYQLAFALYQFMHPPIMELDYTYKSEIYFGSWKIGSIRPAHRRWFMSLFLQLLSILSSAIGTFSPLINNQKFESFKNHQQYPNLSAYLIKLFQMILHLFFATGVVYLERSKT